MNDFVGWLLSSPGFMPHGHCYLWQPGTLWLNVGSDGLIAAAYFAIPLSLYSLVRRRGTEIPFRGIFLMFAAFILLCGLTHLMEIWTVWNPMYRLSGALKLITGIVSLATTVTLFRLMPLALQLRSPQALQREVELRTAELGAANATLRRTIDELERGREALHLMHRQRNETNALLATTLRSIGDAVIATDADGSLQFMNTLAERLTGWTEQEAHGRALGEVFQIIDENSRESVQSPLSQVLQAGSIIENANPTVLMARNGTEYPIEHSAAPIVEGAAIVGVVLIFRDVTARRAADNVFRSTFENAAVGIAHVATDGRWLRVNEQLCRIVGYQREELLAGTFGDITHPDDLEADWKHANALLAGDISTYAMQKRYVRKDSSLVWVNLTVSLVRTSRPAYFVSFVEDITARKASEALLAERERRYAALADAMPQLVWVNHPDGTNDMMNHRWEAYTGLTLTEMRRDSCWRRVMHPEDVERARAQWTHSVKTGERYEIEYRLRRHDGAYCWFLARAEADRDPEGNILRWFGTCTDINASKTIEEKLRQTETALREEDKRKDVFVATLSHELRNPLAPIRNAASLLENASLRPEDIERSRVIIGRQVRHMASLLDDLLDISRIKRGVFALKKEYVVLQDLLAEAVETTRSLIDAKRHTLSVDWPPAPVEIQADPVRLVQVVTNLLTNAAKYTDAEGQITLGMRAGDEGIVIFVRDTGVGLAPEMLPRVFDMFAQVHPNQERTEGGLGIGLALVKGLVELHGGRVEARSDGLERGSEFTVYLPDLSVPTGTIAQMRMGPAEQGSANARRILIADDNRDGAESLAMLMSIVGHEVYTAHDGPEALQIAAQRRPQIAVLDIGMPGLSGYDVAREIRREAWGVQMLLIAVTGWGQEEDKRKAQRAGFDHHLTKPVDPRVLEQLFTSRSSGEA